MMMFKKQELQQNQIHQDIVIDKIPIIFLTKLLILKQNGKILNQENYMEKKHIFIICLKFINMSFLFLIYDYYHF